jgi:hypothetical protein
MTTDKQIELIDELAAKCCKYYDMYKSCITCWRRTCDCDKYITLAKLVQEGCRLVPQGEWLTDKYGMERSICSLCGAVYEGDGGNYCRNCGARMTEE